MTDRILAARRLRSAIELSDVVLKMRRQHLKRQNPQATEANIDRLLNAELRARPADGDGVVGTWPRRRV